jgi:exodeoxyribonuclease V alpha subunit
MLDKGDIGSLAEVLAPKYPALAMRLAADIVNAWQSATVEPAIVAWLDGLGVSDMRLVRRVVKILGVKTRETLECNPYVLAAFMDRWTSVDELGLRLLKENGIADPKKDISRLVGAVDFVIRRMVSSEGHTVIDEPSLRTGLSRCLKVKFESPTVTEAIRLGEVNGAIIPLAGRGWRAPGCALLEDGLAARFRGMMVSDLSSEIQVSARDALGSLLDGLTVGGPPLHPEQRDAVLKCVTNPLAVLTGGAGVGKTTTVRAIVALWEALGGKVALCALAGKAALRLSAATGREALTIHRLLLQVAKGADELDLGDTKAPPRLDARTLLIVDEASMVNLGLCHRLVQVMPPGCRLLMVGDIGQLPPIGFGIVFHRLAEMPEITAELKTIHRQSEGSGIPAVSRSIREGAVPSLPTFAGPAEGVFILPCLKDDIPDRIEQVVADLGGFQGDHALQVVAPVNEGDAGVVGLNQRFHEVHRRLRDVDPSVVEEDETSAHEVRGYLGQYFALGEPVIHRYNDYDRGLYNGSLGVISAIDPERRKVHVNFGGELVEFDTQSLLDISLAYCLTCHRLQGSQSERIVVALYDHPQIMDTSWIYTAITRGEKQVVLVGDPEALKACLSRPTAWRRRRTAFGLIAGGDNH